MCPSPGPGRINATFSVPLPPPAGARAKWTSSNMGADGIHLGGTHRRTRMTDRVTRGRKFHLAVVGFGAGFSCIPALATDIIGVLPAALDQPRVYAIIRPAAGANPYV